MMKIIIKNRIYIYNYPPILSASIKKALTIPNPRYQVMLRKGNTKALYTIKKDFKYYFVKNDWLIIGRGLKNRLLNFCKNNNIQYYLEERLCDKFFRGIKSNILKLRDYQHGVIPKILEHTEGVIKLDTGFGKTIIALKLVEKTKLKTLIIVPRNFILKQFVEEAKKWYNYDIGIIQKDRFEINGITVATIQTLQAKKDILRKIREEFGMVIVDECHQFITDKRLRVIQSFNPYRLYGLSGTPERDDGQTAAIFFVFGQIIIDKQLPREIPTVYAIDTNIHLPVDEYADMVSLMIKNDDRNKIIADVINKEAREKRKILVLTKRIEHSYLIEKLLDKNVKSYVLTSKISDKQRNELFLRLQKGEEDFDVIIGTFSLLSTGVNLAALSTLVIAGDLKSQVLTRQSAGRCLRTLLGKPNVKIYDFVDNLNPILYRQYLNRKKLYKSEGWEIIENKNRLKYKNYLLPNI